MNTIVRCSITIMEEIVASVHSERIVQGLENVKIEHNLACIAHNLTVIVSENGGKCGCFVLSYRFDCNF